MSSRPRTIMVIRHGEKPPKGDKPSLPSSVDQSEADERAIDEEGKEQPRSLTARGWQRAGALAVIFGAEHPAAPLVRPTALMSPDYGKDTPIHRPTQTIRPLARKIGVTPTTPGPKGHEERIVKEAILSSPGDVLVCWEHDRIPVIMAELAHELSIAELPATAEKWPDDDFDSVIIVACAADGSYTATVVSQEALDGDGTY